MPRNVLPSAKRAYTLLPNHESTRQGIVVSMFRFMHKGRADASYKTPAPCPCWIIHSGFNVSLHAAMKREWHRFITPNTQIQEGITTALR